MFLPVPWQGGERALLKEGRRADWFGWTSLGRRPVQVHYLLITHSIIDHCVLRTLCPVAVSQQVPRPKRPARPWNGKRGAGGRVFEPATARSIRLIWDALPGSCVRWLTAMVIGAGTAVRLQVIGGPASQRRSRGAA